MLEVKNTRPEMKNVFDKLTSSLETTQERISGLENKLIGIIQTETQKRKTNNCGIITN